MPLTEQEFTACAMYMIEAHGAGARDKAMALAVELEEEGSPIAAKMWRTIGEYIGRHTRH